MTQWGIDTLFNPGKRHTDEEKRRLQATREEAGDSSGGRRIDLESGTVRISRKRAADPADPEANNPAAAEANDPADSHETTEVARATEMPDADPADHAAESAPS